MRAGGYGARQRGRGSSLLCGPHRGRLDVPGETVNGVACVRFAHSPPSGPDGRVFSSPPNPGAPSARPVCRIRPSSCCPTAHGGRSPRPVLRRVSVSSLTHGPPAACLSDFRMLTGGCRHPLGFQGPCHSPSLTSGVGHFSSDVCWPLTGHQVGPILKTCHVSCLVSAPVSGRPLESSMGPMTMALPGLPPLSLRPVLFLTWAQQSAQLPQSLAFVLSTNPGS